MGTREHSGADRSWASLSLTCIAVVLAANLVFLGLRLAGGMIDKHLVADSLRDAFVTGAMTTDSYPRIPLQGYDQYSDCITAQVAVLGGTSLLREAVAPRLVAREQVGADFRVERRSACKDLGDLLQRPDSSEPEANYARFWHGSATLFSAAMLVLPVGGYKALLLNLTLGLIALAAVLAALRSRALLAALSPLLCVAFVLGGQTGYGHLISYGPASLAVWSLVVLMLWRPDLLAFSSLVVLAASAGALEAFFDQIISVPLVAGIFLITACTLSIPRWAERSVTTAVIESSTYALAWLGGFGLSYASKLAITVIVVGPQPLLDFAEQLAFRAGSIDPEFGFAEAGWLPRFGMYAEILKAMTANNWRLGYSGDKTTGVMSLMIPIIGGLGWLGALHRFLTIGPAGRRTFLIGGAGYLAASVFLLVWVLALPEHTLRHSFFMVRATIVWFVGGWGCLFAQAYAEVSAARAGHVGGQAAPETSSSSGPAASGRT